MNHSTCSIDDCDGITGVSGTARGLCSKHYNRLLRNGDPLVRTRRKIIANCTLDGCDKPHDAKGLCTAHITNLRRHGTPTPRKQGEVIEGKKICADCKVDVPVENFYTQGKHLQPVCRACASVRAKQYRSANADRVRAQFLVQARRHALRRRDAAKKRRAQKRASEVEPIESLKVMERDGWACKLCELPIPLVVVWPHPLSASIDHIIPLSLGGAHVYSNIQASHLECNMRKGARAA